MKNDSAGPTRRSILKASAVISGGALLSTSGSADELEATPSDYDVLRGSVDDPITDRMIQDSRADFADGIATANRSKSQKAYLNLEAFEDAGIYGYNIFTDNRGDIREQFVVVGSRDDSQPSVSSSDSDRLTKRADGYLEEAAVESISTNEVSAQDWDIDWADWDSVANDTVEWVTEPNGSDDPDDARPGMVIFNNRVRSNWDDERIAARTEMRLESGREHCLDDNADDSDEYCSDDTIHTGWRNKEAHLYHDWNQGGNSEGDVVGLDPAGNTSEGSRTRSAEIGLNLARDPSLELGYGTSVTMEESELTERTTTGDQRTHHQWEALSSDADSARYSAEFEIGTAAKYNDNCGGSTRIIEIEADIEWGIRLSRMSWINDVERNVRLPYDLDCGGFPH